MTNKLFTNEPSIKIDGRVFKGISRRYVEGYALVTYLVENVPSIIYVHPSLPKNDILAFVRYEYEGLEHLVTTIHKWLPSALVVIES